MLDDVRLYFRYIGISIKSQLQYKTSFILLTIGNFLLTFMDFVGIIFLFERFGSLKGWRLEELALFYGIIHTSFAISEAFSRGFDIFDRLVRNGNFDRILLRPRSPILQILGIDFQLMRWGRFLQGFVVLIYGLIHLGVMLDIFKILFLVSVIIGGVLTFSGIFILQATLSFWSVQSLEIANSFSYGGVELASYPLSIYPKVFREIFIFIIPIAFINYFPGLMILGKEGLTEIPRLILYISPIIGSIFFYISCKIWYIGIRHYSSTGS
ncbi:MAG: ABC-2 family transporter protein [bacterium]|nr:ABC-2 family transporter protein [bacterium]